MRTDTAAPPEQVLTEAEFYAFAGEDCNYQFLGGELVMEPSSLLHEDLFAFLSGLVRLYLEERGGGMATGSRATRCASIRRGRDPALASQLTAAESAILDHL